TARSSTATGSSTRPARRQAITGSKCSSSIGGVEYATPPPEYEPDPPEGERPPMDQRAKIAIIALSALAIGLGVALGVVADDQLPRVREVAGDRRALSGTGDVVELA